MAGSFRKLWIVMVYENEGADLPSLQHPSQRITQFAHFRRCRANVSRLRQRPPSLFRIGIMARIIRLPKALRDNSVRVPERVTGKPQVSCCNQAITVTAPVTHQPDARNSIWRVVSIHLAVRDP